MSEDFWKGYTVASIVAILAILIIGNLSKADDEDDVETLIASEAVHQGLDPKLAVAIAKVESGLNHAARGPVGEVGLFQIRPEYAKTDIYDKRTNIREGVRQLLYWKAKCPVQESFYWVSCYNQGARKPRHPALFPYVKKVQAAL